MSTSESLAVGQKLVEMLNAGQEKQVLEQLYSRDIVSLELPGGPPDMPSKFEGMDALLKKHEWWNANNTVHGMTMKGPFPHGDRFILFYTMDITAKTGPMANQRMTFEEAALYTVAGGKIVKEEYFYTM